MTLTTTWKNSGRMGILDSAFASMKAAKALAGEWLFMHDWKCQQGIQNNC